MTAPESQVDTPAEAQPKKTSIIKPVIVIGLVAVAVAGWAGYVWATGTEDGFDFRRFAMLGEEKPLVIYPVRGEVYFNGEAVDDGHIEAVPKINQGADRLFAPIKPDGSFAFYTDIGGRLNSGLPEGEYKLLLIVVHPSPPLTQPGPKLPDEYYEAETTPISITVTSDPAKNHFVIKETGEIQPNPYADRMAGGGGGGFRRPSSNDETEPPADDAKEKTANEANEKASDEVNEKASDAETGDDKAKSNDASDKSDE